MDDIAIREMTIKALIAHGQLTDEALHEILGEGLKWDGERVVENVSTD